MAFSSITAQKGALILAHNNYILRPRFFGI